MQDPPAPHVGDKCYMVWLNLQRTLPTSIKNWSNQSEPVHLDYIFQKIPGETQMKRITCIAITFAVCFQSWLTWASELGDSGPPAKIVLDNNKVKVTEITWKPGQQVVDNYSEYRVIRVLNGGTLSRTYSDGKTEKMVYRDGEVYILEPSRPYANLNIGKSDIVFSSVQVK